MTTANTARVHAKGRTNGAIHPALVAPIPNADRAAATQSGHFGINATRTQVPSDVAAPFTRDVARPVEADAGPGLLLAAVFIATPQPRHVLGQLYLVAPLGHEVEDLISGVHHVEPARVRGVSVEDAAALVAVKDAHAR